MVAKLLKQFSIDTGISQKDVAARLGFSNQRVNNYYRGIAEPPFEFYEKFRTEFSVDLRALIDKERKQVSAGVASFNPVPVYDFELKAVKELDFFNHSELVSYYVDVPLYNDCFAAVKVTGGAMAPNFEPGDLIPVKRIANMQTVVYGEPYLLITEEQRVIRYIRASEKDKEKYFILRATAQGFDDMEIKKTDIKYLFQIKGIMKRF